MKSARQLMSNFRSLVKAKGWSVDELYDLLKHGAMALCQPSYSAVAKWMSGDRVASGDHLLAILEFTQTHSANGIAKKRQSSKSAKPKTKRK
jgi:hypothetical protein